MGFSFSVGDWVDDAVDFVADLGGSLLTGALGQEKAPKPQLVSPTAAEDTVTRDDSRVKAARTRRQRIARTVAAKNANIHTSGGKQGLPSLKKEEEDVRKRVLLGG
jgi:hypothetical protein